MQEARTKKNPPLHTTQTNPSRFQDHPLKTVGGTVFTRMCYICLSKYLDKGHNSVRDDNNKNITHNYVPWVTILVGFKIIH